MKTIQSVHRAIQILNLFSLDRTGLGISEISRLTNLNKGTVQGLIRTLLQEGFLRQNQETRKYQLGIKLYELGIASAWSLEINQRSFVLAHDLAKRTEQHVRVAILDNGSMLVTLEAYPKSLPLPFRPRWVRIPLYCGSLGKAILAFLDPIELEKHLDQNEFIPYTSTTITSKKELRRVLEEIRQLGYSVNREERLSGRASIAAPIFNQQKQPIASICLAGYPRDILGESMEDLAIEVSHAALEISFQMGYSM